MNDNFDLRKYLYNNPLLIKENMDLETAKQQAEEESKNGYVVHVNQISDDEYELSDWYDDETTVISFENGNQLNEEESSDLIQEKKKKKKDVLPPEETEEETDDIDIEDIAPDTEEEPMDEPSFEPSVGLSKEEQEIQNSLKIAYDNALKAGDEKLAEQIGNTITFFTRTHIVTRRDG